jgi:hypothetical protein
MTGDAEVIQLAAFRGKPGKSALRARQHTSPQGEEGETETPRERKMRERQEQESVTETGRNLRLRQQRHVNWRKADALVEYWHASLEMNGAIHRVQNHDMPEGGWHPEYKPESHWTLVANWRAALMQQLLTPAPTISEVTWKRAKLKAGQHKHTDVKPERIERAIADDVEFLRTHPVRQSGNKGMDPQKLKERREWKAAFRARVILYAEQNGIDESELAWLSRIKHQDLAAFGERHRLSYNWLLTGEGTPTN